MTARAMALCFGVWLLTACPGYSPEFSDCKVKCSTTGTCPANRECKQGFCRPPGVMGSCECTPGAQRPCGGGQGVCNPGVQSCTNTGSWGQCVGEGKPTGEICDGKDNDCNGSIDDSVGDAPSCPMTRGVCNGFFQKCVSGAYSGTCDPADYGPNYEAVETRCDSIDNDCNGIVDATAPSILMSDVSEFTLAEFDGGFSIVGVQESAGATTTEYQVVLLRLTASLLKRGPLVPVSPPAQVSPLNLSARGTPAGTTFVAWASRAVDAGVNLSAVDSNGIVSQFPTYLPSEKDGDLSLAVNASKALVTWPAHFGWSTRLVTWDLVDGGISARDFGRFADGGYNAQNEFYSSRLSPTGRAIGIRGYDNDGGNYLYVTTELPPGTKTSTAYLGPRYEFVEVGALLQTGWSFSYGGFFQPESGFQFKGDAFNATPAAYLKQQNDQNITTGAIGRGQNSAVVAWTERNATAVIATPFGNGSQARQRILYTDGGFFGEIHLGHPGGSGQLIGIVWRDTLSGPGNVNGMMICQP